MINQYEPSARRLLQAIEQDPQSFTHGRRNDDLCNWYFAHKLLEIEEGIKPDLYTLKHYHQLWREHNEIMNAEQRRDMDNWDNVFRKLGVLYDYYNATENDSVFRNNLWVDQGGYPTPTKKEKV